jgi:ubiquinone/menaquinone biosynthesis C-methylase UbiE
MAQAQQTTGPLLLEAQNKIGARQFDAAISICRDVLAVHARDLDALNTLAIAYAMSGRGVQSVEVLSELVVLAPDVVKYKTNFAKAIGMLVGQSGTTEKAGQIKQAIQICLEDDQIAHKVFNQVWYLLLMQDFVLDDDVDLEGLEMPLSDPFLYWGLRRLIGAGGVHFEQMMTRLRKRLLFTDDACRSLFLPFLCALAEQCHFNEYVYACGDEEREMISAFDTELCSSSPFDFNDAEVMSKIALMGCYQDIDQSGYAQALNDASSALKSGMFASMVELLVVEPLKVRVLQADIPVLSSIDDEVSSAVREQYEDNPYPRWRSVTVPSLTDEQIAKGRGKRILIAGCGTGQEILNMALHYPEVEMITGIDLSCASLAYGKQKAVQLGIENVEFIQADILGLGKLDRQFDMVVCSGVLHHMNDPVQGWCELLTCLKPDGVMKIGLYSAIAREGVTRCQQWIKEQGYAATPEGISLFRQDVMAMDDHNPLRAMVEPIDFYSMSMCRDLLFHVQEHVYTLSEIDSVLDALDLQLLSLNVPHPAVLQKYRMQYPSDPQAVNLENWHVFEQQNPQTFVGMYNFWCCQKGGEMPEWVFVDRN